MAAGHLSTSNITTLTPIQHPTHKPISKSETTHTITRPEPRKRTEPFHPNKQTTTNPLQTAKQKRTQKTTGETKTKQSETTRNGSRTKKKKNRKRRC
ncbi:hypothetical protein QL285_046839 [Trifolium repens]|nr:hypothetical protein QL285_046839 [Trifolium repens]